MKIDIKNQIEEIDAELMQKKNKLSEIKNLIANVPGYDTIDIAMELKRIKLEIDSLETRRKKLLDRSYEVEIGTRNDTESEREQLSDSDLVFLDELLVYLKVAEMSDLARRLSNLRYAFRTYDSDNEISNTRRSNKSKIKVDKNDHEEIKKSTIRLSKEATRVAKAYKDLYRLYLNSKSIVLDIRKKGISKQNQTALIEYFNSSTSEYFKGRSLGYEYLDFYRNYTSKYNVDIREHRF